MTQDQMTPDERDGERYLRWCENRSAVELELQKIALNFEEKYFKDLRLITPSIRRKLLGCTEQGHDGKWSETEPDFDDVSIEQWIFRVRRLPELDGLPLHGLCEAKRKTISIKPGLSKLERRVGLLHEMIHAYESQLSQPFREWLLLNFHQRMCRGINRARLQWFMDISTHAQFHTCTHGVLFLVKSLDLDLRFGWKFGTVFGYGRANYFGVRARNRK
jgi:hypothetical protein